MVCNFSSHFGFTTLEVNPMAQAQGQTWIWATQELGRGQLQDRGARRWLARRKVKEKEEEEQTCSKQHLSRTCGPAKGLCMGPEKGVPPNKVLQKGLYLDLVLELGLAKGLTGSCKRAHTQTCLQSALAKKGEKMQMKEMKCRNTT